MAGSGVEVRGGSTVADAAAVASAAVGECVGPDVTLPPQALNIKTARAGKHQTRERCLGIRCPTFRDLKGLGDYGTKGAPLQRLLVEPLGVLHDPPRHLEVFVAYLGKFRCHGELLKAPVYLF